MQPVPYIQTVQSKKSMQCSFRVCAGLRFAPTTSRRVRLSADRVSYISHVNGGGISREKQTLGSSEEKRGKNKKNHSSRITYKRKSTICKQFIRSSFAREILVRGSNKLHVVLRSFSIIRWCLTKSSKNKLWSSLSLWKETNQAIRSPFMLVGTNSNG